MISELFMLNNPLTTNLGYGMGTYTEVYNNSDTTAYLDGMYLARTPLTLHGGWLEFPCDKFNLALREDSTALTLSSLLMQFPGSGRDYPIKPGEAKVIAMDAIDHNAASPNQGQVDLSRAEFEQFASDADTDNPFSANMIILSGGTGIFGRGYPSQQANLAYVLLSASAKGKFKTIQMISTYGTGPSVGQPADASQVPRAVVLDMLSLTGSPSEPGYAVNQAQTWNCIPFLSPVFERAPAPLATTRNAIAISRKTVSRTSDGREVLQRTRTSARDFEYHEPLLRSLRK